MSQLENLCYDKALEEINFKFSSVLELASEEMDADDGDETAGYELHAAVAHLYMKKLVREYLNHKDEVVRGMAKELHAKK